MLAARMSSSGSGGGDHRWVNKLVSDVEKLTSEIREITRTIGRVPNPAHGDVEKAHRLVGELLGLIEDQVLPRQGEIRRLASASGPVPKIEEGIKELRKSGQEALSAIDVYKGTLGNEQRQRQNEHRSNARYSADQKSLHKVRYEASGKIDDLLGASEGFLRFISS